VSLRAPKKCRVEVDWAKRFVAIIRTTGKHSGEVYYKLTTHDLQVANRAVRIQRDPRDPKSLTILGIEGSTQNVDVTFPNWASREYFTTAIHQLRNLSPLQDVNLFVGTFNMGNPNQSISRPMLMKPGAWNRWRSD
jgi:hypothetical protein